MFFLEAKGFDISVAGAKDTEWIGPIYGARTSPVMELSQQCLVGH